MSDVPDDERSTRDEQRYILGHMAASRSMLFVCLRDLIGFGEKDDPLVALARLASERTEIVRQLRLICDDHGDNDWLDDANLGDVIEKHLAAHLEKE